MRLLSVLALFATSGCHSADACLSMAVPPPLLSQSALVRVDLYAATVACVGPTVAADAPAPLLSRSFPPTGRLVLAAPPGRYTLVVTTFADAQAAVKLGGGCTTGDFAAGAAVCIDLGLSSFDAGDGVGDGGAACGKTALLADDFVSPTPQPIWNVSAPTGSMVSQGGGELVIALLPNSNTYAGYETLAWYDLTGSQLSVEVTQVPTGPGVEMALEALVDDNNLLLFDATGGGGLAVQTRVGGVKNTLLSTTFDPVNHRFWQLREAAGVVYFEASPDGQSWSALGSAPTPPFANQVLVSLSAGTYKPNANPGAAHFAHLNGGQAVGGWCKTSSLHDDFSGSTDLWHNSFTATGCSITTSGGQLAISLASGTRAECARVSGSLFDLTDDILTIETPSVPPASLASAYAYMKMVSLDRKNDIRFYYNGGTVFLEKTVGGTNSTVFSLPYAPSSHWWRFREQAGMLTWQTSPDGNAWAAAMSIADPFALTGLQVAIGAGTAAEASASSAQFRQLNSPPP